MVWKISEKKKVTEKEIQQTALYGLLMIVPLAFSSMGNRTFTIHRIRYE